MPETVIEEREHWTLAVNRNQDLLGKTMVVLRRPCVEVVGIDRLEWSSLMNELQRLVPTLTTLFAPDQFNFAFLMNMDAQVHMHVVPRYSSVRQWRGHQFDDQHWGSAFGHEQRVLDVEDLGALAADIRETLAAES